MERKDGGSALNVETPPQFLSQEKRIDFAEKIMQQAEIILAKRNSISNEYIKMCRERLKNNESTNISINDMEIELVKAVNHAVFEVSQQWYSWIRDELLKFSSDELHVAGLRLGLYPELEGHENGQITS